MEETLKLILNELIELKEGQLELKRDVSNIKDNLINGLGPYFERVEKQKTRGRFSCFPNFSYTEKFCTVLYIS